MEIGSRLYEIFKQRPNEVYPLMAQRLMLETVLRADTKKVMHIEQLKQQAIAAAPAVHDPATLATEVQTLMTKNMAELPKQ